MAGVLCCFAGAVEQGMQGMQGPLLSFPLWRHFSGPYGHQSGTMSLVPGVVYGAGFCHSKAWWRLFILAPPRVPDLASGRTLTALAAPSASSKVFSRNFSKGSHFAHGDTPLPRMWRKPGCAMQPGIFPCRSQEGPLVQNAPGALAVLR